MCPKVAVSVQFAPHGANSIRLCHLRLEPCHGAIHERMMLVLALRPVMMETKRGEFRG
jgi:hypothetical protein